MAGNSSWWVGGWWCGWLHVVGVVVGKRREAYGKEAGRTRRRTARGGGQDEVGGTGRLAGGGNWLWLLGRCVAGRLVVH